MVNDVHLIIIISLIFIAIPPIFAQIETANQYGTLAVEHELYEIPPGESTQTVKISGKIEKIQTGFSVNIMITTPDGLGEGSKLIPTEKGFFETYVLLNEDSQRGQYEVFASYESQIIGSVFFHVQDQELTVEELEESRNLPTEQTSETIQEPSPVIELSANDLGRIENLHNEADKFFENKNYQHILSIYDEILSIEPNNIDALNRKGVSLLFLEKFDEAMPYFDKVISIDPILAKAYYNKALVYDEKGNFNSALNYLNEAIEIESNNMKWVLGKGIFLYFHERYTDAINQFDKVLEQEPDNVDALDSKSLALSSRNQKYDQFDALTYRNKVLEVDPDYPDALHNKKVILNLIGQDYDRKHHFDLAISYYDKILEIDPNYLDALNNKAVTLYNMGKFNEALSYYDKALSVDPNYVISLTGKGTTLIDLGRYEDAIPFFDKAIAIDPSYTLAQQNKQFSLQEISLEQKETAEKEQQSWINILIIVGIVVAVGIGGGLAWFAKSKAKSNIVTVEPGIEHGKPVTKSENIDESEKKEWEGI